MREDISGDDSIFRGAFPRRAAGARVILVEALAQTAGLAAGQPGRSFRLTAIKAMKFSAAAGPDEEIHLHAKRVAVVGGLWQFDVLAITGARVVAEGVVVLSEA